MPKFAYAAIDTAAMVAMTEAIALRDGEGDLLAEGPTLAAEKLGHGEIAMAVGSERQWARFCGT